MILLNAKTPFVVLVCDIFSGVKVRVTPKSTKKSAKGGLEYQGLIKTGKLLEGKSVFALLGN